MERRQGWSVVIWIVVLVGAAVGLNYMQHLNSPTEAELQAQQQAAQEKAMAASSKKAPPPPPPPASKSTTQSANANDDGVQAPPDLILGNPKNPNVLALGYTVDTATFNDPSALNSVSSLIEGWAKQNPKYTVKIVCLDLPSSQLSYPPDHNLPLGLSVNGTSIGGCDTNPGAGIFSPQLAQSVLQSVK